MKVVIDCSNLGGRGGIEKYTKSLVRELAKSDQNDYIVLTSESNIWDCLKNLATIIPWHNFVPFLSRHVFLSFYLHWLRPDVVFFPTGQVPLLYFKKSVVTVHDLAIYKNPGWFPAGQSFSTKVVTPSSIKKATKILAVSNSTARDLQDFMNVPKDKIAVIPEAPAGRSYQDNFMEKSNFILFIGTIEPRKNISRILKAFAELVKDERFSNYSLLLAGKKGWKYSSIFKVYEELNLKSQVKFLGYVDESHKRKLYEQARLFVFPSLYEGFGLPILEAQRAGVPVITSKVSAMPEVAGDGAILVNPKSISEIKQAMVDVLSDEKLRNDLIVKGRNNAKKFSWKKTAEMTAQVFKEVVDPNDL